MSVNAFVSALWHSYSVVSTPCPVYDCGINGMGHPVVHPTACRSVCLQAAGGNGKVRQEQVPFAQVTRGRQSGTSFAPAASSSSKGWCRSWLRTTWFPSPGWHSPPSLTLAVKQNQGHEEKLSSVYVKGIFSASLASSWVSDRVKMTNYRDSTGRLVLTRNCRDHV